MPLRSVPWLSGATAVFDQVFITWRKVCSEHTPKLRRVLEMTQLSGTQSSAFRDTLLFHPTGTHLHNTLPPAVCVSLPLHVEQNRRSNVFGGSNAWKSSTCPCNGNHPADMHFSDCQQICSAHSAPLWAAPRAVGVTCRSPGPTLL